MVNASRIVVMVFAVIRAMSLNNRIANIIETATATATMTMLWTATLTPIRLNLVAMPRDRFNSVGTNKSVPTCNRWVVYVIKSQLRIPLRCYSRVT